MVIWAKEEEQILFLCLMDAWNTKRWSDCFIIKEFQAIVSGFPVGNSARFIVHRTSFMLILIISWKKEYQGRGVIINLYLFYRFFLGVLFFWCFLSIFYIQIRSIPIMWDVLHQKVKVCVIFFMVSDWKSIQIDTTI